MGYIGKIKTNTTTHSVASTLYGTCDTAANTQIKVVNCAGFDTLEPGVTIYVKFTYGNTYSTAKLNVNNTGAVSIAFPTSIYRWQADMTMSFTYYNSKWWFNTDIINLRLHWAGGAVYVDRPLLFTPSTNSIVSELYYSSILWCKYNNIYLKQDSNTESGEDALQYSVGGNVTSTSIQHYVMYGENGLADADNQFVGGYGNESYAAGTKTYIEYIGNGTTSEGVLTRHNARYLATDGSQVLGGWQYVNTSYSAYTNDMTINTTSNNGVTGGDVHVGNIGFWGSATTPSGEFLTSNYKALGEVHTYANSSGRVINTLSAYNMTTAGKIFRNRFYVYTDKDGTAGYDFGFNNVTDNKTYQELARNSFRQSLSQMFKRQHWYLAGESMVYENITVSLNYGLFISSGRICTLYLTGSPGSYSRTLAEVASTGNKVTDWFTITLNNVTDSNGEKVGNLVITNKTSDPHGLTLIGF